MSRLRREVIVPKRPAGARARAAALLAASIVLAAGAVEAHLERYSNRAQKAAKVRVDRAYAQHELPRTEQPDRLHSIPTERLP